MSLTPKTVPTGAIRYNTDSNKMECFNGTKWMQVAVSEVITTSSRGIACGGYRRPGDDNVNIVQYVNGSGERIRIFDLRVMRTKVVLSLYFLLVAHCYS